MKNIIASLVASASIILFAAPAFAGRTVYVSGSGSASDSDRSSADSQAKDQAETQANAICVGKVISTSKTMDSCMKIGEGENTQYTCMVSVKAECELPGK